MKHAFAWLTALALTIPQITNAEGTDMTQDQQDALATIEAMTSAFHAKDIAAVMATYENAPTVLFEPGVPVTGGAPVEQMFSGMVMSDPQFTFADGHEVIVNGDIALHITPWSMTAAGPDGTSMSQTGLSVAVLRRQADGSWKMVIDNPHGARLMP
jgi:ketosteroid isomerase-like protein